MLDRPPYSPTPIAAAECGCAVDAWLADGPVVLTRVSVGPSLGRGPCGSGTLDHRGPDLHRHPPDAARHLASRPWHRCSHLGRALPPAVQPFLIRRASAPPASRIQTTRMLVLRAISADNDL